MLLARESRSRTLVGASAAVASLVIVAASNACSSEFGKSSGDDAGDDAEIDAGADAEPPYPGPPYGIRKGSTIANLVLKTRVPPSTEWIDKPLSDYYDPFNKKKIYGIALEANSSFNEQVAGPCIDAMVLKWPVYDARGARLMEVLIGQGLVKPADGDKWIEKHKIPFAVALDPDAPDGGTRVESFPTRIYINPRTMKIVEIVGGAPSGCVFSPELDALLDSNNAPNP